MITITLKNQCVARSSQIGSHRSWRWSWHRSQHGKVHEWRKGEGAAPAPESNINH
jgi:hypothetical protein